MNKKSQRQRQSLQLYVRLLEKLTVLVFVTALFYVHWMKNFNILLNPPFQNKGNFLMLAVYLALTAIFLYVMGGLKIGTYRCKSVILSQIIAYVMSNFVYWLIVVLMVGLLDKMGYLAFATLKMCGEEILGSALIVALEEALFHKLFPPKRMLILYEKHQTKRLQSKIQTREDQYHVVGTLKITENWEKELNSQTDYQAVLLYDISSEKRNDILKYCYMRGIKCYIVPKISDILIREASEIQLFDTPIFLVDNLTMTYGQRKVKRAMDIAISLIGIILSSPFMLCAAIAIKWYDHGPVLYKQKRCTINGRIFEICKFRSMITDAEKDGVARLATEHDSRITPVGNFIRKTRIDELPQFFNVLKGDMSIVGPRPERPEIIAEYCEKFPEFVYRTKVKAGLTGYAQVYGKYNTTNYDKLKLDLMYIQKYSAWLDLKLILMTFKIIFMKESTEGLDEGERIADSEDE